MRKSTRKHGQSHSAPTPLPADYDKVEGSFHSTKTRSNVYDAINSYEQDKARKLQEKIYRHACRTDLIAVLQARIHQLEAQQLS